MIRFIKIAVLVGGASLLAGAPVHAQDLNALNPLNGLGALGGGLNNALGIDLDPFHIFSPAPAGPGAEAPAPRAHHRHLRAHHAVAHRHIHLKAQHSVTHKAAKEKARTETKG